VTPGRPPSDALAEAAVGAIGLLGAWGGVPWPVPNLGPTLALQAASPEQEASRPWNVLVGHAVGVTAGLLAVYATGARDAPPVAAAGVLVGARVAAAAVAIGIAMAAEALLRAQHPPAQATTLLGAVAPSVGGVFALGCGVLLAAFGEGVRRLVLRGRRRT
jgi:hypothetical protein